jgi:uncharacterized protein (TIRG00374 family)
MRVPVPRSRRLRLLLVAAITVAVGAVAAWRAPDLAVVGRAFSEVGWLWVAAAIGLNLLSVSVRAIAWDIALRAALPGHPRHRHVFGAFCVGLLGNAVLPGRVGEIARVAVLSRHVRDEQSSWAAILGSVFAHRLFDVVPTIGLVVYVVATARIPSWARPGVEVVLIVGGLLSLVGVALALRLRGRTTGESRRTRGRVRRLLHDSLAGLRVLHSPGPALLACFFQLLGWTAQVFAVYIAFRAFGIDEPIAAAALVLLVVNVALVFPLWPGSVGLFQAAVALALLPYGVGYQRGFAYGIGLQVIEISVGVGLGLAFLAREGLSFAALKRIPGVGGEPAPREPAPRSTSGVYEPPRRRARTRIRPQTRAGASERVG